MKSQSALSIRIPVDVKAWLAARAEANSRTLNGEILAILKDAKGSEPRNKQASSVKEKQ